MKDIECPYCGEWSDVDHEDGQNYEQDRLHEMECPHCEKNFVFYTSISFSYSPKKADCLNGWKHEYEPTHTCPIEYTKMECRWCGDRRDFTEEEKLEFFKSIQ
jgi:hypothetical protein